MLMPGARPLFGQVTDAGMIECLYHGWQFDGANGACTHVPQVRLPPPIPPLSIRCVVLETSYLLVRALMVRAHVDVGQPCLSGRAVL